LDEAERRGSGARLWIALAFLLAASIAAYGQDEQGRLSPHHPMQFYWFRTERPIEPGPIAPLDLRLQETAEAFGRGDFALARSLAQGLLDSADTAPDVRGEAAAFLIKAYLAEGDFDGARKAAQRAGDADALARVNGIEARYKAEVGRLQQIVATTTDPEAAARAQVETAMAHEAAGLGWSHTGKRSIGTRTACKQPPRCAG